jgi:hypothetical protein
VKYRLTKEAWQSIGKQTGWIKESAAWQPFGESLRYEGESDEQYKQRLLKEKERLGRQYEILSSKYQAKRMEVHELQKAIEETNDILAHVTQELEIA